jgi:hypothetical protein
MNQFRKSELSYFYEKFLKYSGIDHLNADDYEKLCFYFDAFVFTAVASAESEEGKIKRKFNKISQFHYVKALRNISAHYGPPHIIYNGKSSPFFTRRIHEAFNDAENKIELKLSIDSSINEINNANDKFKQKNNGDNNGTYISAIAYLNSNRGKEIMIHEVLKDLNQ